MHTEGVEVKLCQGTDLCTLYKSSEQNHYSLSFLPIFLLPTEQSYMYIYTHSPIHPPTQRGLKHFPIEMTGHLEIW